LLLWGGGKSKVNGKGKGKVVPVPKHHAMKTYWGWGYNATNFDLGTKRR